MEQEYTNLLLLQCCNVLFKLIDKRSHVQFIYRVIDELPTINRLGLAPHDEIEKIKLQAELAVANQAEMVIQPGASVFIGSQIIE
jgi:hypothetical protein